MDSTFSDLINTMYELEKDKKELKIIIFIMFPPSLLQHIKPLTLYMYDFLR